MNDKKILIVDFDTESLIALSNIVYEEGFHAETATDGLAAYEKFRSGQFDLVILEPMLPKLHGFELCKKIVNDPERRVPVIIVTAIYREPSCKRDALTVNGAAAFFTKPYNRDDLRSKMLQLLVEGPDRPQKKAEAPAESSAQPKAPAAASPVPPKPPATPQPPSPATHVKGHGLTLQDLLDTNPVPKETRAHKPAVNIERELQAAVAGLVGPVKKKEAAVRKEPDLMMFKEELRPPKEKKETKVHEDQDIDALLKDAISGLAVPPKKKNPEVPILDRVMAARPESAKREPAVKPVPAAKPETRTGPSEKIPVAEEIKQRLPFQPGKPNNIPRPPSRVELGRRAVPFDIDRTLIEIDQIPLDDAKPARETPKSAPAAFPSVKKSAIFEEFAEPAKTKPKGAIIGAAAAVLVLAAGVGFLVLKPKKPSPSAPATSAAVEETVAAAEAGRPPDAKPYPDTAGAELKPEPKRAVAKPAAEAPVEIGAPIQPTGFPQETLVELQEPPAGNPQAPSETQSGASAPVEDTAQQAPPSKPEETPAISGTAMNTEPAAEKAREGALVALDQAESAPVLMRKVDPKYPPLALKSNAGGTVTVNALISEKGDVLRTEILKGVKDGYGLEGAAETAIRRWKFRPARKDGVNVRVWKAFDITFKPNIKMT
ncbi:MAG: hypothetical protein A2W03_03555 [Candidatus Aminicenantes bacterium RBG_16_63_16]|nr:MAG: hypothetical protein A2W03_03555 [Candidatus Aminicenantes bacterium RBG_16_63_16]